MNNRYEYAKEIYSKIGIDTEEALKNLAGVSISLHCWQGDYVTGFDSREALSGGIQTTGNYPGKATTPQELMDDLDKAFSYMPGKKKLNLHASYELCEGCLIVHWKFAYNCTIQDGFIRRQP